MHHETPDRYEILLNAGTMMIKTGTGWREAHDGLRDEVIKAALSSKHVKDIRKALRRHRPITFHDPSIDLTVLWRPVQAN